MHLLTTKFDYSSWFAGRPLIVAASKNSVDMVKLLLEVYYDASISYGTVRKLPEIGRSMAARDEVNRALLESIYRISDREEERNDNTYAVIRLLISQGGSNPHLPVYVQPQQSEFVQDASSTTKPSLCSKPLTKRQHHHRCLKGNDDIPLSAAVRAADADAVRVMIDTYSNSLAELKSVRRKDPLLRSQPESYFQLLEEKEDDKVYSSVDAALVTSLFLLWQENSSSFGRCAIVLYQRGQLSLSPASAAPRHLSQRAMDWLDRCLSMRCLVTPPMLKNNVLEGYHFEAPIVQYCIPLDKGKKFGDKVPYHDAGANFMDWSHVLAELPWFSVRTASSCSWMQSISESSRVKQVNYSMTLAEDEFFLVADGKKLLAHKSIVSARSGKLAAQIRFTEKQAHTQQGCPLSVHVELPLLVAKMLLCHCYHGSSAFGLIKSSPLKQCHQLLEMALVAEEYLCPSLMLECEIRLLMQTSPLDAKKSCCLCSHCSGETISSKERMDCPIQQKCLENANMNIDNSFYCKPAGVYAYKPYAILSSKSGGLITPESAIDVLAVAQQLEQSLSCQEGSFYAIKYCRSGSLVDGNSTMATPTFGGWTIDMSKEKAGCISVPFAAAKMMAVWIMLRDFPAVIKSESYMRQINGDNDDDIAEGDASFSPRARSGNDEDAILLLQTCLGVLSCSPFN